MELSLLHCLKLDQGGVLLGHTILLDDGGRGDAKPAFRLELHSMNHLRKRAFKFQDINMFDSRSLQCGLFVI